MPILVFAVDHPELPAFKMPARFRHDITYFCTPPGVMDAPKRLGEGEYWIRIEDAESILEDGVLTIVSPLDSASRTEIEITEEQEEWLAWMTSHRIQRVRLQ